ncbi:SHQ1 protein-domain-containing protein [Lipomyces arxii]|uniref:SHQ1 protein-domain-containing protein n=1 Tax=Lipomyces arxii TaxID=56418 RepID=UPI0034CD4627
MITPHFSVRQDDEYVYIDIKVTHIKAQNVEIRADGDIFIFSLPPYYLRLHLSGNVVDDDRANAEFNLDSSLLAVKFPKESPGQDFPDLDMVTKLLARVGESNTNAPRQKKKVLIEELDAVGDQGPSEELTKDQLKYLEELNDAAEFDWQITQELPAEDEELLLTARYGFNSQYSGFLRHTADIGNDINELESPETSTIESRTKERIEAEDAKFDPDYYLSDLLENEDIPELIAYTPARTKSIKKAISANSQEPPLTAAEQEQMLRLPRRTYLIDSKVKLKSVYLNLVPLIFAHCYDARTTMDDHTSESAWTMGKLAANIADLDSNFTSVRQVLIACIRRALAYPLYRNWQLSLRCLDDVYYILRGGKRAILKVLLDVNHLFEFHDVYYCYSKVVTEDYCAWIQTASDSVIRSLAHDIHHCEIKKEELNWNLTELEQNAQTE